MSGFVCRIMYLDLCVELCVCGTVCGAYGNAEHFAGSGFSTESNASEPKTSPRHVTHSPRGGSEQHASAPSTQITMQPHSRGLEGGGGLSTEHLRRETVSVAAGHFKHNFWPPAKPVSRSVSRSGSGSGSVSRSGSGSGSGGKVRVRVRVCFECAAVGSAREHATRHVSRKDGSSSDV